jgi:hypothetical protein
VHGAYEGGRRRATLVIFCCSAGIKLLPFEFHLSWTDDDSIGGAMIEVVRYTAQLAPEDRAAIAACVKSLPPVEGPRPTKK